MRWQNCYFERLIGTIRRECTDDVIPMGETNLLKTLATATSRAHLSRLVVPPPPGRLVETDIVAALMFGGLHHRYSGAANSEASSPLQLASPEESCALDEPSDLLEGWNTTVERAH